MLGVETNYFDREPLSVGKVKRSSARRRSKYLPPLRDTLRETIGPVLDDISCHQETKEYKKTFEHDWVIEDVFDEVWKNKNGQKLESELFYLNKKAAESQSVVTPMRLTGTADFNRKAPLTPIATSSPRKPDKKKIGPITPMRSAKELDPGSVCEYFATNSKWNIVINTAGNKSSKHLSVHAQLYDLTGLGLHRNQTFNVNVTLKLTFHIVNPSTNKVFGSRSCEKTVNLKELIRSFRIASMAQNESSIRFGVERFCLIDELNGWLSQCKPNEFCIVSDLKLYQNDTTMNASAKNTVKKEFKHLWTIGSWADFLNDQNCCPLQSNGFYLKNHDDLEIDNSDASVNSKIEKTLEQLKWRLQLYPNGIGPEANANMSLFLCLSEVEDELKSHVDADWIDLTANTTMNLFDKKTDNNRAMAVRASFQIKIIDSLGKTIDTCRTGKQPFQLNGCWGYKDYLRVSDLAILKEKYKTRSLRFKCAVTVYYTLNRSSYVGFRPTRVASPPPRAPSSKTRLNPIRNRPKTPVPSRGLSDQGTTPSLNQDLRHLYRRADMYDLIIQAPKTLNTCQSADACDKVQFKVHKLILSMRSSVFERMIGDQTLLKSRNTSDTLDITDFDACTVDLFLKYLYGDSLELTVSDCANEDPYCNDSATCVCDKRTANNTAYTKRLVELVKISEKYCVHKLKHVCELKLAEAINCMNLLAMLSASHLYGLSFLKQHCFGYLVENLACLMSQNSGSCLDGNIVNEAIRLSRTCSDPVK
jgi:hypothetical protein